MNSTPKFLTYAQNLEDVLLWRALGHVRDGFYIDVGANDPVEHSVTKAFYDAGWRGINIEPLPAFHEAFVEQRPRDINLAIAAGNSDGSLTLYDVADVNGWASPDLSVADSHRAAGHEVREITVPVRTLASVCSEHVQGEIHFLKVDVEGFEGEVLRGMDFARWRPWVLVIEATVPGSRETMHEGWEHIVLEHRYRFVWFDGLNRYYVAEEHPELLQHFGVQPNVFDEFLPYHLDHAWRANRDAMRMLKETETALKATEHHADNLSRELHKSLTHADALEAEKREALENIEQLRQELASAHASGHQATEWARDLEQRLLATYASTSWKVTKPLRRVGALWRRLRQPGLVNRLLLRTTRNQRIRRIVIPILLRFPPLNRRVSHLLHTARQNAPTALPEGVEVPPELRSMPASVRAVLADLQRARQHQNH